MMRKDNGDVVIDGVPMVDQGQKGYCAVATVERLARYFGLEVDQHEMAQVANTHSDALTNCCLQILQAQRAGPSQPRASE